MFKVVYPIILPTTNLLAKISVGKGIESIFYSPKGLENMENGRFLHAETPQFMYVLSDDVPKEGDWKYNLQLKQFWQHRRSHLPETFSNIKHPETKVVIASDDPELNLPKPSTDFMRKYVKLQGEVEAKAYYNEDGTIKSIRAYIIK